MTQSHDSEKGQQHKSLKPLWITGALLSLCLWMASTSLVSGHTHGDLLRLWGCETIFEDLASTEIFYANLLQAIANEMRLFLRRPLSLWDIWVGPQVSLWTWSPEPYSRVVYGMLTVEKVMCIQCNEIIPNGKHAFFGLRWILRDTVTRLWRV